MTVPNDLMVDVRNGLIVLRSGDKTVTVEHGGRHGVFTNGPLLWTDFYARHVLPALSQLTQEQVRL